MTVRQGDLWWSDFYRIVAEVEKNGARAWMWSNFIWHHEAGFDQICCGSTWNNDTNFGDTVKFCREVVAPQRLKGFLNASWAETCPKDMEKGLRAIDQVGAEIPCHVRN